MSENPRAADDISAQCPSCRLHELVVVTLEHQPNGTWQQKDEHGGVWSWLSARLRRTPAPDTNAPTVQIDACP
ncbi:MAG: hypothetical protein K0V04_22225, partial [Deltaproteobacteria bacterium]|nr:hypothetical protein [Deltaproteobacteria bacterium]